MGYIYKITNTTNNKCYIGQTIKNINDRIHPKTFCGHKGCVALYRAIKKYGPEKFAVDVISQSNSIDELNLMEKKYIIEFKSNNYKYGYNIRDGGNGGGNLGKSTINKIGKKSREYWSKEENKIAQKERSIQQFADHKQREMQRKNKIEFFKKEENRIKISKSKGIKLFYAFNYKLNEIYTFESTTIAAEKLGIIQSHISAVLLGKRKTCGGWRFTFDNPENYKNQWTFYAIKDEQILKFDNQSEASMQLNCDSSTISAILNNKPHRKSANGWKFSYEKPL